MNNCSFDTTMTKEEYLEGLGMPAPSFTHQRIINRININFVRRFPRSAHLMLLGVDVNSAPELFPDISFWQFVDKDDLNVPPQNPMLSIEITHTRQNGKYSENSILKAFASVPSLQEAFLYNYTDDVWYRYKRSNSNVVKVKGQDYSSILKIYLHTLLK